MTMPLRTANPAVILPADASKAVEELGLSGEILREALLAGETGAGNTSRFHPVGAAGSIRWIDTVGQLRQQLCNEHGWKIADPKNSPRIVNPDKTMAVMVMAGDANTGNPGAVHPGTARKRGPATDDAVNANQLALFDFPHDSVPPVTADIPTWVLLYFRSDDPSEIRAELSFPTVMVNGEISWWRKRIVLESIPIEAMIQPQDAGGEDVTFDVGPRE